MNITSVPYLKTFVKTNREFTIDISDEIAKQFGLIIGNKV